MWPRAVNAAIGFWLMMSQFIFAQEGPLPWNDLVCGALIFTLSLAACWRKLRMAMVAAAAVAAWIVVFGYFGFEHVRPPRAQNGILTGLVFLMFALVPSEAAKPPESYRGPAIAAPLRRKE